MRRAHGPAALRVLGYSASPVVPGSMPTWVLDMWRRMAPGRRGFRADDRVREAAALEGLALTALLGLAVGLQWLESKEVNNVCKHCVLHVHFSR